MIKEFEIKDLDGFEPNAFSDYKHIDNVFDNDAWWKYSLVNDGVKAIIAFGEEENEEWAAFAFVSKHFTARDSVEMRRFLNRAVSVLKPSKLWTISPKIKKTDRWHRWLGFILDSDVEFKGVNYNRWVMA